MENNTCKQMFEIKTSLNHFYLSFVGYNKPASQEKSEKIKEINLTIFAKFLQFEINILQLGFDLGNE